MNRLLLTQGKQTKQNMQETRTGGPSVFCDPKTFRVICDPEKQNPQTLGMTSHVHRAGTVVGPNMARSFSVLQMTRVANSSAQKQMPACQPEVNRAL